MPFIRRNDLSPASKTIGGPDTNLTGFKSTVITNSAVMRIGDVVASVIANSRGHVRRYNAAGDLIIGICVGFGRANGRSVTMDAGTTDTVTVAADNETVAQIYAIIDVTPYAVWSAPLDGTIHTTQRAYFGTTFDPDTGANAGRIAETSATRTYTNGRALACVGVDELDTTRALVMILESAFNGYNGDS